MRSYIFEVELEEDEDGRWSAIVSALPGCSAWGGTKEEALEAARQAAVAYVQVLVEDGRPVPSDREGVIKVVEGAASS
jgi:predicted RNase H-like HicB family nuclease